MPIIKYSDGTRINFSGTPTNQQAEEAYNQVKGISKRVSTPAKETSSDSGGGFLGKFATGVGSSFIKTAKGIGDLIGLKPSLRGEKILNTTNALDNGTAKNVGKFVGDVGQLVSGSSVIGGFTKALPVVPKILIRALGSGGIVAAQQGKIGLDAGIAAATEGTLPIISKLTKPVLRLISSLSSGLSGVPSKAIDAIIAEPTVSKSVAKIVDTSGQMNIVRKNAETIINGVSKIRQEARTAYGNALETLREVDINPQTFRTTISDTLNKYGSVVKNGIRKLTNIEFSQPKNIQKANDLIKKVTVTPLDGASLRKVSNEIDSAAYKTTGSDPERLSFNVFVRDLSNSVRQAIGKSTTKLTKMNKAYSTDFQLTDAVEGILGKVKYKNLDEVRKVSQQLEGLFSKSGISPQIIDDFLTRIGVKPSEFRASEAVRQISNFGEKTNSQGLTVSEVTRGITSSIITPKAIRNASILTGIAEQKLLPILKSMAPSGRAAFIQLLVETVNKLGQTTNQ